MADQNYIWIVLLAFLFLVKNEVDLYLGKQRNYLLKVITFSLLAAVLLMRHYDINSVVLLILIANGFQSVVAWLVEFLFPVFASFPEEQDEDQDNEQ